jgi:hypothetical protein
LEIRESVSEGLLTVWVTLDNGPLEPFIQKEVALPSDTFKGDSDLGIISAPVWGNWLQGFGTELGIGRVHGVVWSVYGARLGIAGGIIFIDDDVPGVFGGRNVANDGRVKRVAMVVDDRAARWKGFTGVSTIEARIYPAIIFEAGIWGGQGPMGVELVVGRGTKFGGVRVPEQDPVGEVAPPDSYAAAVCDLNLLRFLLLASNGFR